MDANDYFLPSTSGSKGFSQQVQDPNATGFGAAADDYADRGIDLNEQLIRNKAATFFMRVNSDAMSGAGIHEGDVVIVDRSLEATSGKVVIASVNGELLIRRLEREGAHKARLVPASKLSSISLEHYSEKMIWGVVTYVIHHV
jgi:DNA polymerase V